MLPCKCEILSKSVPSNLQPTMHPQNLRWWSDNAQLPHLRETGLHRKILQILMKISQSIGYAVPLKD